MITDILIPFLTDNGMNDDWFQQNGGTTAHTARTMINLLRLWFLGRLISKYSDFDWPLRSPDLTPSDYFLRGYLKSRFSRSHES
ncbi:Hypothetical protein CINCED_3A015768 [Cinara cedri]|uniref:Uncharacterized protein n=1 Tax=Cinara cedri TaxID=506608 RepID=A0A5E4NET1_9HEMI|nr:Hypothetical protein CINCED_3A015768 [Cinara cedri]